MNLLIKGKDSWQETASKLNRGRHGRLSFQLIGSAQWKNLYQTEGFLSALILGHHMLSGSRMCVKSYKGNGERFSLWKQGPKFHLPLMISRPTFIFLEAAVTDAMSRSEVCGFWRGM